MKFSQLYPLLTSKNRLAISIHLYTSYEFLQKTHKIEWSSKVICEINSNDKALVGPQERITIQENHPVPHGKMGRFGLSPSPEAQD